MKNPKSNFGPAQFKKLFLFFPTPLPTLILVSTLWFGCASHNMNPPTAQPHTGYVDIFDPKGRAFSWDIRDGRSQHNLYRQLKPETGIVRLALPPGSYQLTITILNTVISDPATINVQVVDGQVTPVQVRLAEEGTTVVEQRHTQAPGRYLRRTKITDEEAQSFRLEADVLPSMPYRPKERVSYALR